MVALPGWDDIESVGRWVTFWEVMMIIVLAALVGAEVFHFRYSHRLNDLIAAREEKAKNDADVAEARRKTEVQGLEKKLTDADKKFLELQQQQADRHLTDEQKRQILAAILPYPGQQVDVSAVMSDGEGIAYANEFLALFREAKWKANGVSQNAFMADVRGVNALFSNEWALKNRAPIGVAAFLNTLNKSGLLTMAGGDATITGDDFRLIIGRKPAAK